MNLQDIFQQINLTILKDKLNLEFIDLRIEETNESIIQVQNKELISAVNKPSIGAFIRIFDRGNWVYLSTTKITQLEQEINKLAETVKKMPQIISEAVLPKCTGEHNFLKHSDVAVSKVTIQEKVDLVKSYIPVVDQIKNLQDSRIAYKDLYKIKYYKSSVGTDFKYDFNQCGFSIWATLKEGEDLFSDRYMNYSHKFNDHKNLNKEILDYFDEAQKFLHAPTITPGKYKILLSPELVGIFTHESFGHKSEADFMMGDPDAKKEWVLGSLVGANCLSIVDSGLHENTSGYCPIDDEGTLAQKNYLIKNGILTGRLHSSHTAGVLEEKPTGNFRALNFEFEPIVRMTSTYIEPGTTSKEELYKMAEGGYYFDGARHGTGGSTFTIAPTRGYKIINGKLAEPVRASVISGSVFETLKLIEAVGSDFTLESSAFGGCGKNEQFPLPVSDGGPTILISAMQIS